MGTFSRDKLLSPSDCPAEVALKGTFPKLFDKTIARKAAAFYRGFVGAGYRGDNPATMEFDPAGRDEALALIAFLP